MVFISCHSVSIGDSGVITLSESESVFSDCPSFCFLNVMFSSRGEDTLFLIDFLSADRESIPSLVSAESNNMLNLFCSGNSM